MSDKGLCDLKRHNLPKTVGHKRSAEENFRDLFRHPSSPALGMAYLQSFLTEQHCNQLRYIFCDIGYDLNFPWIP